METARSIDAKGLSVTIPFKQDVMACLDEIDDAARQIGAINTVVFACGEAYGCNTDWLGIKKPLAGHKGARAVLLGAGGVAAAAAYALMDLGMEVTILNRSRRRHGRSRSGPAAGGAHGTTLTGQTLTLL